MTWWCVCGKTAHYGFLKQSRKMPRYCAKCKMPEMKNLSARRCDQEGCHLFPAYGFKITRATRCKAHKLPGMINRAAAKCRNCHLFASFNFEGQKSRIYCRKHKKVGMINLANCRKQIRDAAKRQITKEVGDPQKWSQRIDQLILPPPPLP